MDNKPQALSRKEIEEIAAMEDIRQMWGAESAAEMEGMLDTQVYAVKFDYQSGGPGYVGDLYILLGDTPDEPLRLIRVKGTLEIFDQMDEGEAKTGEPYLIIASYQRALTRPFVGG